MKLPIIFIIFIQINLCISTLLIGVDFSLQLPNGETVEAAGLFADYLRVEEKPGGGNAKKLSRLQAKRALGIITSQQYYTKALKYISGGILKLYPKIHELGSNGVVAAFTGDAAISKFYEEWANLNGNKAGNLLPPIDEAGILSFMNQCFFQDNKLLKGAALVIQGTEIYKYTGCSVWVCWRSRHLADGYDHAEGAPIRKRLEALGYGADSEVLKSKLADYLNNVGRIVRTKEQIFEDMKQVFNQVYATQNDHPFMSSAFSAIIQSKQDGKIVAEEMQFVDNNIVKMIENGIEVSAMYREKMNEGNPQLDQSSNSRMKGSVPIAPLAEKDIPSSSSKAEPSAPIEELDNPSTSRGQTEKPEPSAPKNELDDEPIWPDQLPEGREEIAKGTTVIEEAAAEGAEIIEGIPEKIAKGTTVIEKVAEGAEMIERIPLQQQGTLFNVIKAVASVIRFRG